ncbi:hypothetical protein LTR84_005154 [Exophiala bonariae]|uniref:Linalool dehydratase/isomerase domain-containing protein n=1 Tax=Exophiala bonariae TaxID=1690606 RepID=A0AAV9NNY8_9EURO|nr:hypothetical protein LTR84_005154 [Exophiala bonariae]
MATTTITRTTQEKKLSGKSLVGNFSLNDVLVPEKAGTGLTKWHYQRRTLLQYAGLFAAGLTAFYKAESPALRAAGMGGVVAPIVLWTGTSLLAAFLARDSVLELAGPIWTAVCISGIAYITYATQTANAEMRKKREVRNEYLINAVSENQSIASEPKPGSREMDERTLRFTQWILELGLTDKDDWSYHDIIDQFQTSAIRYQLYESVSDLGMYQYIFTPNFHGYLSQAQRNLIEKSLTEKVVNFWKYESMAGKFNAHDWDPIVKDNIMVSGYILQAIGIYQSNTGDDRYAKKDSLEFVVDKNHKYKYDLQRLAEAVYRNMDQNPWCLYPCEPNWLYTMCNLVGTGGLVASDRLLGNNFGERLKKRFEHALETEFTTPDGSILPIRSELTGFTLPGLAGALADGVNAILCSAYLPHIAHRNWAFTKKDTITYDKEGKLEMLNLVGADKLDPGNYKAGEGCIRAIFAAAAAEFGDEKIRKELLRQLDEDYHPVFATRTGALKNKGISTLEQGTALRGRLGGYQDWTKMIQKGPEPNTLRGPILDEVPFPEVLVAKAYSQDGEGIDMVFYNGKEPGTFKLGFTRLKPGAAYHFGTQTLTAAKDGTAQVQLAISGRTAVKLTRDN